MHNIEEVSGASAASQAAASAASAVSHAVTESASSNRSEDNGGARCKVVKTAANSLGDYDFASEVELWDISIPEGSSPNIAEHLFIGADAAILMFDVTKRASYNHIPLWHRSVTRVCENVPMVLCGNKRESKNRVVKPKDIQFHRKKLLQYYDTGSDGYNIRKPLLYIGRKLLGDPTMQHTFSGALCL